MKTKTFADTDAAEAAEGLALLHRHSRDLAYNPTPPPPSPPPAGPRRSFPRAEVARAH